MGLDKAYLAVKGSGDKLDFHFNPKEVDIKKSALWKDSQNRGAKKAPPKEFIGTNARTLGMELLFEGWHTGRGDVTAQVQQLFDWTCPTPESMTANKPQPPVLVLHWGAKSYFEVYVKQVDAKYTMFDEGGTPIRATVKVMLEELPQDPKGQNPTSGGNAGRRTHGVVAGDSLPSIAYQEYRRPSYWRALAEVNGIDDPMRLRPGSVLLVPPMADASRLSAPGGSEPIGVL